MARLKILLALSLVGCATSRGLRTPDEGGDPWRELVTPHFNLVTNLPAEEADAAAQYLERALTALTSAFWPGQATPPGRMRVLILADPADLAAIAPKGLGGFETDAVGGEQLIVLAGGQQYRSQYGLIPHELVHCIAAHFLRRQPAWLAEGMASYAETLDLAPSRPAVMIGYAHTGRAAQWQDHRVPLQKLIDPTNAIHFRPGDPEAGAYYGSAWMLVHYLRHAQRALFQDLLARLGRGEDPGQAWADTLGQYDPAQVDQQITDYGMNGRYMTEVLVIPPAPVVGLQRMLTSADAHALRAELRMLAPLYGGARNLSAVRADVAKALELDPAQPEALLALRVLDGPAAVAAAAARAPKVHPENWLSWEVAAEAAGARGDTEGREALLEQGVRAAESPWLLWSLAVARGVHGDTAAAYELSSRAARLAPWDAHIWITLALAAALSGHCDEALAARAQALETLPERAVRRGLTKNVELIAVVERKCPP